MSFSIPEMPGVSLFSLITTQEKFASDTGLTVNQVRKLVFTDALPTVKIGKRRYINNAQLVRLLLEEGDSAAA